MMVKNVDDFKDQVEYWLDEVSSFYDLCEDDQDGIKELRRIISLINCDVVYESREGRKFWSDISLDKIINILSDGGKIKKLSEVNFDE